MENMFETDGNLAISSNNFQINDSLKIMWEMGFDQGKYSHIKVSFGLVDVRTLTSEIKEGYGYQRLLHKKRVDEIVENYLKARFDPITISIRDGKRNIIDGQARVSAMRKLFKIGSLYSPMIPCKILQFATVEDEALLFAEQNDGQTTVLEKDKVNAKLIGKDEKIVAINNMLNRHGLGYSVSGKGNINANKTLEKLYDTMDHELLNRALNTISQSWESGQVKNSNSADILKGITTFYKHFGNEIDDEYFVSKLIKTTPDVVRRSFKNWENPLDRNRQYLKALSIIYNKGIKSNKINYL